MSEFTVAEGQPEIIIARRLTGEVLDQAGVREAAAVAFVGVDDVTNVDAAMITRELAPEVRLVVRLFNPVLGEGVAAMLGDCAVLSGSEIAAPAFVAATLGDATPTYLRLPEGELLRTAMRSDVEPAGAEVVCGLARTTGPEPVVLPADQDSADLVLVRAYGRPRVNPPRRRPRLFRALGLVFSRNLRLALAGTAALLTAASVLLAYTRGVSLAEAGYLTLLTTMGAAEADAAAPLSEKVTAVVLVTTGVALLPTVTALVVDSLVRARLAVAAGGMIESIDDHVVLVGLGNIGTRVLEELHAFGIPVVAVDRTESARGVGVARELGLPVIVGDATRLETLRAASVHTCRALVVLTADDVTNLETALSGRSAHETDRARSEATRAPLRVVLRLFDDGFAKRTQRILGINESRSVSSLAAPAFAAAMMGRQVIDTISVGRRVLLVADLPVGAGSGLEGRYYHDVNQPGAVRVIAMRTGRAGQTIWSLPERRPLVRTDRLIVLATRAGLAALLPRTVPSPDAKPLADVAPLRLLAPAPRDSGG
ncbi:NAD(P)-binding protein [Micromonospora sp. WMMD710]|uniref:potassium channel family protein n=1 Tax=Micromonospora sp. WMMD710 TaxID=3016085 RepID=UPI002415DDCC|nr:NAD(P)-binding protein [Micromonospora sp. WMMD710]MDG4757248.1 NAD-binding protein [Micromonospora sp. WMMD710]